MRVLCEVKGIDTTDVITVKNELGSGRITLTLNGKNITVYARELKRAIENCTND